MPTWKIWRLLHTYPDTQKYETLTRIVRAKPKQWLLKIINNLWVWVLLSYSVSSLISEATIDPNDSGYWFILLVNSIPAIITAVISLAFAWQVTSSIVRLREESSDELMLLLPANDLMVAIDIARAHLYPFDGHIRGVILGLAVVALNAFLTFRVIFVTSIYPRYVIGENVFFGIVFFVIYTQMFVTATLISFLVSRRLGKTVALIMLVGGYIAAHLLFALLSSFVSSSVITWIFSPVAERFGPVSLLFWWQLLGASLVSLAAHELVNFALWRAVKRRLEA